jgi:hypothetical protein
LNVYQCLILKFEIKTRYEPQKILQANLAKDDHHFIVMTTLPYILSLVRSLHSTLVGGHFTKRTKVNFRKFTKVVSANIFNVQQLRLATFFECFDVKLIHCMMWAGGKKVVHTVHGELSVAYNFFSL